MPVTTPTMTTTEQVDLFIEARMHFGDEHQLRKCAEECCELSTAILRLTNGCDGHTQAQCHDNCMEELADVTIMIDQLWGIFGPTKDSNGHALNDIVQRKLHRLKCRIEEEKDAEA